MDWTVIQEAFGPIVQALLAVVGSGSFVTAVVLAVINRKQTKRSNVIDTDNQILTKENKLIAEKIDTFGKALVVVSEMISAVTLDSSTTVQTKEYIVGHLNDLKNICNLSVESVKAHVIQKSEEVLVQIQEKKDQIIEENKDTIEKVMGLKNATLDIYNAFAKKEG